MTLAIGAYVGEDVDGIVERLLDDQLEDGGWNCWAEYGATVSSFHTTICVLDGLLEYYFLGPLDDVVVAIVAPRYTRRRLGVELLRARWTGSVEGFTLLLRVIGSG